MYIADTQIGSIEKGEVVEVVEKTWRGWTIRTEDGRTEVTHHHEFHLRFVQSGSLRLASGARLSMTSGGGAIN